MKIKFLIIIALFCSLLLFSKDIQTVYADVTITVITPTGGGILATNDCTDVTAGNNIIWLNCSDVSKLFAIDDTTGQVLANITTSGALNNLLACLADTSCVLLNDPTANRITKYLYSGGLITQQSFWNSPCNSDAFFSYDSSGFIWITCSATDQVVRMNPTAMSTVVTSQALTSVPCTLPDHVSFSSEGGVGTDGMGIIHCLNGASPDSISTFDLFSSSIIDILDTEITTSGTSGVMIDGQHRTIMAPSTSVMSVWSYVASTGAMTLEQTITGNTYDKCMIEPFGTSALVYVLCEAFVTPNTQITAFKINATGASAVEQVMNNAVTYNDANAIGLDIHDGTPSLPVWYISATNNNISILRIDGVRTLTSSDPTPPEPPEGGGGGGGTGGVDCADPANANLVICRLGGNGTITSAGDFLIGDVDSGVGIVPIICSTGLIDCVTNPDMATNGAGLLITFVAIAVMVGILWVASRGDLGSVPFFIWIIGTLMIVGFFTIAGLIDVTFLMIAVVAIIALATAKLRGLFGGEFK